MRIQGDKIYIRFLEEKDAEAYTNLQVKNKEFFRKYVTTRSDEFYTLEFQKQLIKNNIIASEKDEKYVFGIFEKDTDELVGNVALTEVFRGPLQSCYIGYYLDLECNGKGYMSEAVKLVVAFGFDELHLHRIEAGVMPHNTGSIRVLEKAGFQKEGIARKNVNINGKWENHQVLAIIEDDWDSK
ncbi:GNAT family protein [Clostridium sp.]|uniref:GNAT family N-acetyltransferase n=1 Tax=Clostridium sp. TaxID=1506 RepID=UPI002FC58B04